MYNPRITDDLRSALNFGTTLPTRFWLSLGMMLYGGGFFLNQGTWLLSPAFESLNNVIPFHYWGAVYLFTGSLGMWRVFSKKSRPMWGWVINTLILATWLVSFLIRYWGIGAESVLSLHTLCLLMAGWCLIRTEATFRDTETA